MINEILFPKIQTNPFLLWIANLPCIFMHLADKITSIEKVKSFSHWRSIISEAKHNLLDFSLFKKKLSTAKWILWSRFWDEYRSRFNVGVNDMLLRLRWTSGHVWCTMLLPFVIKPCSMIAFSYVQAMSNVFDLMFNTVPPRPISTLVLKKCAYIAVYILLVSWECFKGMNGTLKMTILQTFKSASWCNSFKYRIMQRNNDSKKMRCGS